ncbi:hypothetical protein IAR55_003814 [Kwoniella newhampshirensis]|uniref:VHS domain-containing protein n=1 Tax=Kwoniella newhampshirensis TaxID=1651941 RepID=A0AAW0YLT4_9TREE
MDDPWAAPSWSTPAKPTSSISGPERASATPPPSGFDVGDPWGLPTPGPVGKVSQPTLDDDDPLKHDIGTETPLDEGVGMDWATATDAPWGDGGNVPPPRAITPPTTETEPAPQQEAVWTLNTPPSQFNSLPESSALVDAAAISLPHTPEAGSSTPQRSSFSPVHAYSSPARSVHSTYASPARSIHDELSEGRGSSSFNPMDGLPKSPSFGDDFGRFSEATAFEGSNTAGSSGDPWGSGGGTDVPRDESWGGEMQENVNVTKGTEGSGWGGSGGDTWGGGDTSFGAISHTAEPDEETEGDGWGGSRPPVLLGGSVAQKAKEDDEWEEAQRRIRLKQQLAPQEKIDGLTKGWTELAGNLIQVELEKLTGAEEMKMEEIIKSVLDDAAERLRSLSTIPPDVNTYPPVIASLVTHERFVYALQRPNPAPSTSLLAATANRRSRRADALALASSSSSEPSWTTRSRLGEPDAPNQEASAPMDEGGKSRWSFWGKRPQPERQLTTSGGGILEVRSATSLPALERTSSDVKVPTLPPSRAPSVANLSPKPPSPSPSFLSPPMSHDAAGHSAPSGSLTQASPAQPPLASAPAPAPSAVSRFFGRLSRKPSGSPSHHQDADDAKDLELSADDFSFLSEVPSMTQPPPEKGVGDLLALEPGRTEQIASLESLLSAKPAPSPQPLAPPPRGYASAGSRTSSGKFVARMKAPAPTDIDLLGDLNFAGPSSAGTQSPAQQDIASPVSEISSSSAWDGFLSLAPSAPATKVRSTPSVRAPSTPTPVVATPLVPSRSGTPSVLLSPPPPVPPATLSTPLSFSSRPSKVVPTTPKSNDFSDFDDFGTPQQSTATTFDDFGDFSAFESNTNRTVPTVQPNVSNAPVQTPARPTPGFQHHLNNSLADFSTPTNHARPGSLDHTPTINLLSGASASKGRRWPAPPSPVAPILEPPPKVGVMSTASAGFPFLSPPPPSRPSSSAKNDLLNDGYATNLTGLTATPEMTIAVTPGATTSSPSMFGNALAPISAPRTNTSTPMTPIPMLASPPSVPAKINGASSIGAVGGKGGLSAQDLSFFDGL